MELEELLKWVSAHQFHGIRPGLFRIGQLLKKLGSPHRRLRCIHIAGTNGKGSTAAMIESILRHHGFKTALYTSPHLFKLNERFRVNGKDIPDSRLKEVLKAVKKASSDVQVTYFEITTAAAFLYFCEEGVDFAVIECGLGGRLDATNVLVPEVAIITSVDLDHTKYLGSTLEKIAFEKACIVKRKTPCVLGSVKEPAKKVIKNRGRLLKSQVFEFGKDFFVYKSEKGVTYEGKNRFLNLNPSLKANYQLSNIGCAIKGCEILEDKGFLKLKESLVKEALSKIRWQGRFEEYLLNGKRLFIDASHNLEGAKALLSSLKDMGIESFVLILGMTNEDGTKPFLEILNVLNSKANHLILCEFPSPRKVVTLEDWKKALGNRFDFWQKSGFLRVFDSPYKAFAYLKGLGFRDVLITGSLYFIRHWLRLLEKV